jgi:AbrB family looped-hinge helix DNA binding protein
MSSIAKIQHKGQVTIPTSLRNKAGLAKGDLVEFSFQHGKIVITPKVVVDRSAFPSAEGDYTPAQRRAIDARLSESAKDLKNGRTYGPFNTAEDMISSMEKELKKRAAKKQRKRAR